MKVAKEYISFNSFLSDVTTIRRHQTSTTYLLSRVVEEEASRKSTISRQ